MAEKFFNMLQCVFKLLAENRLKKNIDDTLLEKLLTLTQKCKLQSTEAYEKVIVAGDINDQDSSDFIKEVVKRTEALYFIEKVLNSVAQGDENNSTMIKSFFIRFLGLIFEKTNNTFHYENVLPLLKNTNDTVISDHNPSIQDALLFCLSCISRKYDGALWFVSQNLKDFVLSSFNSKSYYVRKSSVNFFINFISQWTSYLSITKQKESEELILETFIKDFLSFIINHIHFYRNSDEIIFAECCITILKQLLESENSEFIMRYTSNLSQSISDCFIELTEEKEFNEKLIDLFLIIHFKFLLPEDSFNDVIKCLFVKENVELAMDLASSFVNKAWSKRSYLNEVKFILLPVYILLNEPLVDCESFFAYNAADAYGMISRKMEDKSACKLLFSSSLSALVKTIPQLDLSFRRNIALELLKIGKCCNPSHKWLYSVLEDRLVHHSLIDFYSSLFSSDVYPSFMYEKNDLIFQNILVYLKKPTTDSNFLSQLLLLMKRVLSLHKKYEFDLEENDKNDLIETLCRALLDKRESVVDSAIHLSGEIIKSDDWQNKISRQGVHSILWDIAIQGSLDGTTRSTALKVIIQGCQEEWYLNEMKSLKNLTEMDIARKLFDLTHDVDFFLQREALSCLFLWIKSKWNELPPSCIEYLYISLVSAIKSLDLELKLASLDIWKWLLENKHEFSVISPSLNAKDYVNNLAASGLGLSMILALEDYDQAVQYKAASILFELKNTLMSHGSTFESLQLDSSTDDEPKKLTSEMLIEPISTEERDKGIDIVMEISTSQQIANICRPFRENGESKAVFFSKERTCNVSTFWTCLWSKKVISVLEPTKEVDTDTTDAESILRDIILARSIEYDSVEDIPDCY